MLTKPLAPMSRFSPPSLLGHPGLSQAAAAAAAAAGHHHLPQIKQELNGRPSHKNSPCKKLFNLNLNQVKYQSGLQQIV